MKPVLLPLNTPRRFYRGGRKILSWRGQSMPAAFDEYRPEDWMASTTRLFAESADGLSVLPDQRTLADAIAADPSAWLGDAHIGRYGATPGLLVKLLDAAERLPVHAHPDRGFAARHLSCGHGKTEAWLVLDAEPDARVWLGLHSSLSHEALAELVTAQDDRLLAALHEFPVQRGDVVLVPAGQPHAIGAGIFVIELQEPTDFSIMLEHARFGIDQEHAWLGLDPVLAQSAVDHEALSPARLSRLRTRWDGSQATRSAALPDEAGEFFHADVLDTRHADVEIEAAFSVLLVIEGSGALATRSDGHEVPLAAGQTLVTPYSSGALTLTGGMTAIRCRPSTTHRSVTRSDDRASITTDSEAGTCDASR